MSINESFTKIKRETAAMEYAAKSIRVFPCHGLINGKCSCGHTPCKGTAKPGKHPATHHGCKDATINPQRIKQWWGDAPWLNVAIATGDGVMVIDADPRHGSDATLETWRQTHGKFPPTPTVLTGSGGTHHYFRVPKGVIVKSRAGVAPGIDVRGNGGYVIAPPSLHDNGKTYEWLTSLDTPLADAPEWLLAIVGDKPSPPPTLGKSMIMTMGSCDDLLSHDGAGEGERNATLCRLVGIHLARGDSLDTVLNLAMAWANRCDPPFPEREVKCVVMGLGNKEMGESRGKCDSDDGKEGKNLGMSGCESNDNSFLPSEETECESNGGGSDNSFPPLHADAYHGIAGAIVNAIASETEADTAGILLSLLACVGNAIGKGPRFAVGTDSHPPSLFICLCGGTADGKGMAWGIAKHVMKQADNQWASECLCSGLSSGEGLVERVQDDDDKSEHQGTFAFAIPTQKRLLCIETEFAKPITAMRREGSTLSPVLRSAWDGQPLEVLTRGKTKLRASNAHIGVVAHITPKELGKVLGKGVEVSNGFANRFLWCHVSRSKLLPHGGDASLLDAHVEPLREALAKARTISEVKRDADANALWESVYAGLVDAEASHEAIARARAQTVRLSMIYALLDGSAIVKVEHLKAALAVWGYCQESARRIFGGEQQVEQKKKGRENVPLFIRLLDAIVKEPGIPRSQLLRDNRNANAEEIRGELSKIKSQRLAYPTACHPEHGGRTAECWYPGSPPDGDDDCECDDGRDEENASVSDGIHDGKSIGKEAINSTYDNANDNCFLPNANGGDANPHPPPSFCQTYQPSMSECNQQDEMDEETFYRKLREM